MSADTLPELDYDVIRSIEWPDSYDMRPFLHHFAHGAWGLRNEYGALYRRALCQQWPLAFALTYLLPFFRDQLSGRISFSEMHMDLAADTTRLMYKDPRRRAEVGPRESGKSTWRYLVGPLWSFAYEYQRLIAAFSYTDKQASGIHLRKLRDVLEGQHECTALLLSDFPELAPVQKSGVYRLANGSAIVCAGLKSAVLGVGVGSSRPTMILGDDLLPGTDTNDELVEKVKKVILTTVLPLGGRAQVILCGTVFQRRDLMDDVVRIAEGRIPVSEDRGRWLTGHGFECFYWRPYWPQRWPVEHLLELRAADPKTFALEKAPHLLDQAEQEMFFTPDTWVRDPRFPTVYRIFSIDHAVSRGAKSDHTAIAVLGANAARGTRAGRCALEHVEQGKMDLREIHARIWDLYEQIPGHKPAVLLWERNNGGEMLPDELLQLGLPEGLELITWHAGAVKAQRIVKFHRQCVSGLIKLTGTFDDFEAQAEAWSPKSKRDDMLDAVGSGARLLLDGKAEM